MPMHFLPTFVAASNVVPEPAKGSSIVPPVGVAVSLHKYSRSLSGLTVGWSFITLGERPSLRSFLLAFAQ